MRLSEKHFRSAGACLGLLLCYYTTRALESDGLVELADSVWSWNLTKDAVNAIADPNVVFKGFNVNVDTCSLYFGRNRRSTNFIEKLN